jgi:hypothetical protein
LSNATLDRALAVLVVSMVATGFFSLGAGAPAAGWIFTLHDLLAGALVAATIVKLRRSVPMAIRGRHFRRLALGLLVSLATIATLAAGYLWVASGTLLSLGSWTVLTLHAWVGLALAPLVAVHLLPRRWRLLRPTRVVSRVRARTPPQLSRRTLLAASGLGIAGVGLFGVTGLVDRLRGGERRFTGSRWLAPGGVPPTTTFYGEPIPTIDIDSWRLAVTTRDAPTRTWSMAELRALGETDLAAVLDCTSGWAIETGWLGVPLAALLGALELGVDGEPGGVRVTSVTGWSTQLTMPEARRALLATGVAGGALPAANGAPLRLVVPDARGLAWVKWVTEIRVT